MTRRAVSRWATSRGSLKVVPLARLRRGQPGAARAPAAAPGLAADGRRRRPAARFGVRGRPARHGEEAQRRVGAVGHHRVERGRGAALQHVFQRGLEQVLDAVRADVVHRLQAELEQRAAVGGQDAAVVADRQLAFVQRVDELRPAVEVQRVRVAEALRRSGGSRSCAPSCPAAPAGAAASGWSGW